MADVSKASRFLPSSSDPHSASPGGQPHRQGTTQTNPFSSQPGWSMAIFPIFCVARSSRTDLSRLVACALKIGKIADGGMPPTYQTMH